MTAAAQLAAETRYAANYGIAATVVIDGTSYAARIVVKRGLKLELDGGTAQQRTLSALILCRSLAAAELIDATTGNTRQRNLTCDSLTYRLNPGGVQRSRHSIYWTLRASSPDAP